MQRTRYLTSLVGTLLVLGASFGGVAAAEPVDGDAVSAAIHYGDFELGTRLTIDDCTLARGRRARLRDHDRRGLRERTTGELATTRRWQSRRPVCRTFGERHRSEREAAV